MTGRIACIAIFFAMFLTGAAMGADSSMLLDFEGSDQGKFRGGEVSTEQAKSGQASLKWADHQTNKAVYFTDLPTDWSQSNQLAFWMWSGAANRATLVLIVRSENAEVEGMDYYSHRFCVDWQGWKRFEIPFHTMATTRKPMGWDNINSMRIVADGWGNEAKEDTLLYIDSMALEKVAVKLVNPGFEDGAKPDGTPVGWSLFSKVQPDTQEARLVDGGRSGQGFLLRDDSKEASLGLMQSLPAEPGKSYRFSIYKKGSPVALYIKSFGADRKQLKYKSAAAKNENRDAFERFSIEDVAAPEAQTIQVIVYYAKVSRGQCVIDDALVETVE